MRLSVILTFLLFITSFLGQASEISDWIRQLGNDEYRLREEASENLRKAGFRAVSELQRATKDADVEISERARELLRLVEMSWVDRRDPPQVREWMLQYSNAETIPEKFTILNTLSDWSGHGQYGLRNGEAIGAFCRVLRYEQEPIVRAEAAREIIAVPPVRFEFRQKWFQTVQKTLTEPGDDFLLQTVLRFADVWEAVMEYRDQTLFVENPQPASEELKQQVREITQTVLAFRNNSEYYEGRRGTDTDILLFYALAELQEIVGLQEELNESLLQAMETHPIISEESFDFFYMPHHIAAKYLSQRYLHRWAKKEFLMVAKKDTQLKTDAIFSAAMQSIYLDEKEEAAELFDGVIQAISEPLNRENDGFSESTNLIQAMYKHVLAELAVERGEIAEAKKLLDEAILIQPEEVDCLILRYRIGNDDPPYKEVTDKHIKQLIANAKRNMSGYRNRGEQVEEYSEPFNRTAWLLANTDGDYELALNAAKKAVYFAPNNPAILDTLAHVYALGKEYDKAVETQKQVVRYSPHAVIFRNALKKFEELAVNDSRERDEVK
ncbi:MAG: hypothetical protein FWC43_06800 [Planctomycetaceae bacterium]|nr:hypothetical protein [Planctomycetaceae bacterium]